MGITAGDIFTRFGENDTTKALVRKLVGKDDFDGKTSISLYTIASYQGNMADELSVFVAEKEGKSYVDMLSDNRKTEIAQKTGINSGTDENKNQIGKIPMDTSIFDIQKNDMA